MKARWSDEELDLGLRRLSSQARQPVAPSALHMYPRSVVAEPRRRGFGGFAHAPARGLAAVAATIAIALVVVSAALMIKPGVQTGSSASPSPTSTSTLANMTASPSLTASLQPKASRVVLTPGPKLDRSGFIATKLADGRILLTGGQLTADWKKCSNYKGGGMCVVPETATAEIYDPRTKSLQPTGSMTSPSWSARSVLLQDGRVLVFGSDPNAADTADTANIYDPATGLFRDLGSWQQDTSGDAGPISTPATTDAAAIKRMESTVWNQTVTVLADGRVLIAGGEDFAGDSSNAVTIFDPTTNTFTNLPGMPAPWKDLSASLLPDGRVLFTGGLDTSSYDAATDKYQTTNDALLFDPTTDTFSRTGNTVIARDGDHQAALQDGRVLIVGGVLDPGNPGCGSPIQAEVYDPSSGRFSAAGGISPSWGAMPVLAPDGRVLLLQGTDASCAAILHDVAAYDPDSGAVSLLASGVLPGWNIDDAIALDDGSILLLVTENDRLGDRVYYLTLQ